MFGQIVSFETEDMAISPNSPLFVMYKVSGKTPLEMTVPTKGHLVKDKEGTARKNVFPIHRPFTRIHGQRLLLQIVQCKGGECNQKLIGYGYCDLEIDPGSRARRIDVQLWHPKSDHAIRNKLCGVMSPLSDINIVDLSTDIERASIETAAAIGKLHIHIQRSGYN